MPKQKVCLHQHEYDFIYHLLPFELLCVWNGSKLNTVSAFASAATSIYPEWKGHVCPLGALPSVKRAPPIVDLTPPSLVFLHDFAEMNANPPLGIEPDYKQDKKAFFSIILISKVGNEMTMHTKLVSTLASI